MGTKVMNIEGGIFQYNHGKRYKTDIPPKGRKVRYLNKNGYDGDRKYANKYLTEGDILTVNEIRVGACSSDVELEEYPGKYFNTVMFEDVEENMEQQYYNLVFVKHAYSNINYLFQAPLAIRLKAGEEVFVNTIRGDAFGTCGIFNYQGGLPIKQHNSL